MSEAERHLKLVEDRPPSIPPPDPLIGRTLDGRYRIEAVLGEGGMGLVYRARHAMLNKPLAIKVLRGEVSRDQEVIQRFQQEAQSASAIGNQHIIDISDFGVLPDGATYFVMEFLDGVSLTKAIEQENPMSPARVVRVAKQLCEALGAAHERNIVHRDMKPDNVYLVKRGQDVDFVKVLDFGIAKVGGASSKLTKAGQVFGTPHYMSPEQCAGTNVDHRTDIYALGVILYEMASGRVPFDADNLMGILTKHMYEQPIPPHELPPPVEVPPGLEAIIMKCLSKSLEHRYQTMAEVREDLERIEGGITPKAVMDALERSSAPMRSDGTGRLTTGLRVGVGAAPEEPPPRRSMVPFIAIGALLVIGLAVGAAAFAFGGAGGSTTSSTIAQPPPVVVVPPPPPPPEATERGTTGTEATATGTVETPPPPPPAERVTVTIESEPAGVEVYRGEALLGNTPYEIPRPEGDDTLALTLRMVGYQEQTLTLSSLTARSVRITLARASSGRSGRRGGSGGSGSGGSGGTAAGGTTTSGTAGQTTAQPPPEQHHSTVGTSEVLDPWRTH